MNKNELKLISCQKAKKDIIVKKKSKFLHLEI